MIKMKAEKPVGKKSKKRKSQSSEKSNKQLKKKKVTMSEEEENDDEKEFESEEESGKMMKMKAEKPVGKKSKKRISQSSENSNKQLKKKKITMSEEEENDDEKEFESEEESVVPNSPKKNAKGENENDWSSEDYNELIRRMEEQIPKDDKKSFGARAEKLDWSQIHFGCHSAADCYEKWKLIKGKVRHFRLLSEILQDLRSWVQNPWTTSYTKKKARHPDQPHRPLSSFMIYYMEKKAKVMQRRPDLKLTDVSKLIGQKYKALPEEKKAHYVKKASVMQEEYRKNLSEFYEKHPELIPTAKKTAAKSNKPLPPFRLYMKEKLEKHGNSEAFNQQELTEKYKELWKSLSLKKKAYWIRKAKEQEEKFLEQSNEESHDDAEEKSAAPYKSVVSKEDAAILDRLAGKPEKPPNSAYSLYSRLMLQNKDENFGDSEPKNRMKEIAMMWKEVPEAKKKEYAEEVKHMQENYKLDFANYLESLPEERRAEELAKVQPKKKPRQRPTKRISIELSPQKDCLFKNEPEKPPVTALDLFKKEFTKKNSHLSSSMAFEQASIMWKNLSSKETEKYKKKHQQLKDKYLIDYEAFLKSLTAEELKEYSAMKKTLSSEENMNGDSCDEESSDEEDEEESDNSNSSEEMDSNISEED